MTPSAKKYESYIQLAFPDLAMYASILANISICIQSKSI